jgi:hypothetical protein
MDKCPNYKNNGYLDALLKKREKKKDMNKIAHDLLQKSSSNVHQKRDMFSKSKSRIRISHHIYAYHLTSTHMHILI